MKRYRITNVDFDTRANFLKIKLNKNVDANVKNQMDRNQEIIKQSLVKEFGELNFDNKLKNFMDLKSVSVSIIAFHNKFLHQIKYSFTIGSYYPALTGACGLGERILNHLIITLREDFRASPEYRRVYNKDSFADWDIAINVLESWNVLLPKVADNFRKLKEIRHRLAMHFNPDTDNKDREYALKALDLLSDIIREQFGGLGSQSWFIQGTRGSFYIKKEAESEPFIKRIYLLNCILVGPYHSFENTSTGMKCIDDYNYENIEISDDEFVKMLEEPKQSNEE